MAKSTLKKKLLDKQLSDTKIEAILEECFGQCINDKLQEFGLGSISDVKIIG